MVTHSNPTPSSELTRATTTTLFSLTGLKMNTSSVPTVPFSVAISIISLPFHSFNKNDVWWEVKDNTCSLATWTIFWCKDSVIVKWWLFSVIKAELWVELVYTASDLILKIDGFSKWKNSDGLLGFFPCFSRATFYCPGWSPWRKLKLLKVIYGDLWKH